MKKTTILGLTALLMTSTLAGAALADRAGGERGLRGLDFETLDMNGDARLTAEDIGAFADARFAAIDADGDGQVSRDEFIAHATSNAEDRAGDLFERLDADGDGALSRETLQARRGGDAGRGIQRVIERFDADGDGGLDAEEFATAQSEMRERGGFRGGRHFFR